MAQLGRMAVALLGILAYQNRDKLGALMRGPQTDGDPNAPRGDILETLSKGVAGTPLGDILERFRGTGSGTKVDSWVAKGPNEAIDPREVQAAIDEDTLAALTRQTGLSRDELLERLSRDLPEAVDRMTPDGAFPREAGAEQSGEPSLLDPVPPRPIQGS